jgi:DNA-binding MarR family transcriptional regulator
MPIALSEFSEGEVPKKKIIQKNVIRVLQRNPLVAISSREFENILNIRRQGVNQALRALERKGLVKRGMIKEGSRSVVYASLTKKGESTNVEGDIGDEE